MHTLPLNSASLNNSNTALKTSAAIIGGGVIGGGWAARFLLNGWDVRVFDPDPEAQRKIGEVLANARRSLPMLYDVALPCEGKLTFCTTIEDAVKNADWVQESVPERLGVKHKVFVEIEKYAPEKAIIGSSTSGFKPSELQEGLKRPETVMVTHPFNPVYLLPLVELVGGKSTSPANIERAKAFFSSLGMRPLLVRKEIEAFIAGHDIHAATAAKVYGIELDDVSTDQRRNAKMVNFGIIYGISAFGLSQRLNIPRKEAKEIIDQYFMKYPGIRDYMDESMEFARKNGFAGIC